jgi:hypothetical protein
LANDLGLSSTRMKNSYLQFLFFIGLLNAFFLVCLFIDYLIFVLMPTALLICTENTFWDISRDGKNFVGLFKESFTLYVESGMREMTEKDIDILQKQVGILVTKDFCEKFYKFIVDHYLRHGKLQSSCFYLHLTSLMTVFTY